MPTESGYQNQKKYGEAQFKTIQGVGSNKFGTNSVQIYLSDVNASAKAVVAAAIDVQNPKIVYVEITAHNARKDDVLRVQIPAVLAGWEFDIIEIVDANIIGIYNLADTILQASDDVKICRWVTAKGDGEGGLAVSVPTAPAQFVLDGVNQQVIKDTVDPSNTIGLPVEDVGRAVLLPIVFDFAATNVDDANWTELSADIGASGCKKAQIFMSSGEPLWVATGVVASEINYALITPGGNGTIDFKLPPNSRLSIMAVNSVTISEGLLLINLIG